MVFRLLLNAKPWAVEHASGITVKDPGPQLTAIATALPSLLNGKDSDFMSQIAIKTQSMSDKNINVLQKPNPTYFKDKNIKPQKPQKTAFGEALNRALTRLRGN